MGKARQKQVTLDQGLIAAAAASSMSKIKSALDFGADVNFQDPDQCEWSALHFACYFSAIEKTSTKICKILLLRGANPDLRGIDGASPLLTASSVGSLDAVNLLLARRAEVNAPDNTGWTPLMGAADRGSRDIVSLLLDHDANPDLKDSRGLTAFELAQRKGLHDVASLIEAVVLTREFRAPSSRPVHAKM